jgi:hypothetical protein
MRSGSLVVEGARVSRLARFVSAAAAMIKDGSSIAARPPRLHHDELTPHMARDLGLTDVMEKPSLSPGIIEQAPRF